jgi:hypothetical protein
LKIIVESTRRIVDFRAQHGRKGLRCRIWEGKTESGIPIQILIPHMVSRDETRQKELEEELTRD